MIANFVYDQIYIKKTKFHFNEFMINFHDFRHKKKDDNSLNLLKISKKNMILYI